VGVSRNIDQGRNVKKYGYVQKGWGSI